MLDDTTDAEAPESMRKVGSEETGLPTWNNDDDVREEGNG
jgi:hypothetical protein